MGNSGSGHSRGGALHNDLLSLRPDGPILFHSVHGDNITISNNRIRAERGDSFCKGVCFSCRPIAINETVYVKFVKTSTNWSGVLRFGFTSIDPGSLRGQDLPRYACPDLTNKPGNWAKALSERYANTQCNLHFYVTRTGDVIYGMNGEEKGIFFSGVITTSPLWALLDIYGNTVAVEFQQTGYQVPLLPQNNLISSPTRLSRSSVSLEQEHFLFTSYSVNDAAALPPIRFHADVNFVPMTFHEKCGRNIRMSGDNTVALRLTDEYCNAYVFTSRPLRCGEKVVIQILGVDRSYTGGLAFGLTACNPSALSPFDLPDDSDLLLDRQEYWVVNKDVCRSPDVGDELSFYLTGEGEVRYSRNNHKVSTLMHVDRTLPLWAFFDVYGNVQKVKLLGAANSSSIAPRAGLPRSRSTSDYPGLTVSLPPRSPNTSPDIPPRRPPPPSGPHVFRSVSVPAAQTPMSPTTAASPTLPCIPQQHAMSMPTSPVDSGRSSDCLLLDETNECKVCCEQPVNCVLYTCGHMCMCYSCAMAVKVQKGGLCPICRQPIQDVIKTYRS
ncbi:protein neuralized-like [Gigantopelta aegis]|uniref:protein neuralized-like n=1 Tax=Gigantopelta aegis TaxID=1735272 RepID=UPI001B8874EC|nr:protein neuralized-like [Gigantopelta aegis]